MSWREDLLNEYVGRGALSFGTYTLAGGGTSDFYIDGRRVTTSPRGLRAIVAGLIEIGRRPGLFGADTNLVVPAVSGIPIGAALALALDRPYVIDRGRAKSHGLAKRFEGTFETVTRCTVVDDLITVGSTLVQTITGLKELGYEVGDAIVVVDREQGGAEALASVGVRLHRLLTETELRSALQDHEHRTQRI